VGQLPHLLPRIQQRTRELINGYIKSPAILDNIENYIVHPGLGNLSGVLGAPALAEQAMTEN
jgi:fructokinase